MKAGDGGEPSPSVESLMADLGYRFVDRTLLDQSLVHASASGDHGRARRSNERLEFLGDRVLGLAIAGMLYQAFPNEDEGALARRYAALVRRETLARIADAMGLGRHLTLSRGEEEGGGRQNPALLSNTCEAVIAAVYLDGGFAAAQQVIARWWSPLLNQASEPPKDAKTRLQEWAQSGGRALPRYREVGRSGPAHGPLFSVAVEVDGVPPVTATGPSKKAAEQQAAQGMLASLGFGDDG